MSHSEHPLDNKLLLGRYRVMRLLGEGGMGTVHLARVEGAEGFMRPVVVKRMKRDIRVSDEGHRLFIREAKILSKLQHPGIVGIVDFGVEDGAHIMVLEYVHGYTLSPWLEYREKLGILLPVDICLFIVRRILDALHYAHNFGTEGQEIEIVHRDVSPDNVLLSNKGYVHLLDFGIASMRGPHGEGATKSGAFRGKLCYAAPETVKAEPATPRSDQYSAAVLLLQILTGKTPFETESIAETFVRMVNEIPEPASKYRDDIPAGLDQVLAKALAKDPNERFPSAHAFSRELRRFQSDDDEVAEQLRLMIKEDFERLPDEVGVEGLRDRESALEKILSLAPGPASTRTVVNPTQAATMMDMRLSQAVIRVDTPTNAVTSALAPQPAPAATGQLQGLLWGLIIVGGLIAVGLGAAVALLSRGGAGGGEPVVVVGDNVRQDNTPEALTPPRAGAADPALLGASTAAGSATTAQVEGAPSSVPSQDVASGVGATPRPGKAPDSARSEQLTAAVQRQSGAFQSCFSQNLDSSGKAPDATLHFSVAKQGGAAQVKVEPQSLATTPLGSCLLAAAGRVQFPELEDAVAFRVPVRARVSRGKGKE